MSTTREALRALVAQYTGLGRTGTVDSGSTSTILDSTIGSYSFDIRRGSIVYITTDAGGAGGAPEEEFGYVTDFDKVTGTVTFSPPMTMAPAVGDTYEIWEPEVEQVARVNEAINRALTENCHYYALIPMGMLADGDCQANTAWSVSAGTKSTALVATPFAFPYRIQRFYLLWTAASAGAYFYQDFPVSKSRRWRVAALMRTAAATTGTITVYDLTNSATISTSGDPLSVTGLQTAGSDWQYLTASFTVPSTCDRISVRIANNTANGQTLVALAQAWPEDTYTLPLPDRVLSENYVGGVFEARERLAIDFPETWQMPEINGVAIRRQAYGGLSAIFPSSLGGRGPFFYHELRVYDALNDDDSAATTGATIGSTDCDDDYAAYCAAWQLMKAIADRRQIADGPEAAQTWRDLELRRYADANRIARLRAPTGRLVVRRA